MITSKSVSLRTINNQTTLLDSISLQLAEGERLGIIGVSGAGKSTFLKLLNRLYTPHQGELFLEGENYNLINPLHLRQKIVLVPQESKLLGMTVKSALIYPLQLQKLSLTEINQRLAWCLEEFTIPDSWLSRQESEISVGQRQLVAIARAMMMQPKVLLLDEPTSALDKGKSDWLAEKLIRLNEQLKLTIITVNHDLDWIKNFVHRIVWLNQGKIKGDFVVNETPWQEIREHLLTNAQKTIFDDF